MGTRPAELDRSVQSLLAQTGVETEIVVVGNGWDPVNIPAGVATHFLPENIGATAGRNAGAAVVTGDYLFFLDDDAQLPTAYIRLQFLRPEYFQLKILQLDLLRCTFQ